MEVLEGVTRVEVMMWKLLKCLYGLKKSPRMWNQTTNKVLEEIGFVRFKMDHGVHVFGEGDARVFIALHVDDMLMMWKQREVLRWLRDVFKSDLRLRILAQQRFS